MKNKALQKKLFSITNPLQIKCNVFAFSAVILTNKIKKMKTKLILPLVFILGMGINIAKAQTILGTYPVPNDTTQIDLQHFSRFITGNDATTDSEKTEKIVNWINRNMAWNYTDHKIHSTKEILKRGGGNSYELNPFVSEILTASGIKTRTIMEVSLLTENKQRHKKAMSKIQAQGNKASLCGLKHANTYWLEYWNRELNTWEPIVADMEVVGMDQWLKAKLKFGERNRKSITQTQKEIVPMAIFVIDSRSGAIQENRSLTYLSDAFNSYYKNKLTELNAWNTWKNQIQLLSEQVQQAYTGTLNLHEQQTAIDALEAQYSQLKQEYQKALLAN